MRVGQRVRVSAEGIESAIGEILATTAVEELPAIDGAPPLADIVDILDEMHVRKLHSIGIGDAYIFTALELEDGSMYDLHHQRLTIEVIE